MGGLSVGHTGGDEAAFELPFWLMAAGGDNGEPVGLFKRAAGATIDG